MAACFFFFLEHEAWNGHGHAASNGSNASWNKFIQRTLRKVAVVLVAVAVAVVVCGGGLCFVFKNQMSIRHDMFSHTNHGPNECLQFVGKLRRSPFMATELRMKLNTTLKFNKEPRNYFLERVFPLNIFVVHVQCP